MGVDVRLCGCGQLRQQRLHYIVTLARKLMQRWVLFWGFFPWVDIGDSHIVHKHMECHSLETNMDTNKKAWNM